MNRFKRLLFAAVPHRMPEVRDGDVAVFFENGKLMMDDGTGAVPVAVDTDSVVRYDAAQTELTDAQRHQFLQNVGMTAGDGILDFTCGGLQADAQLRASTMAFDGWYDYSGGNSLINWDTFNSRLTFDQDLFMNGGFIYDGSAVVILDFQGGNRILCDASGNTAINFQNAASVTAASAFGASTFEAVNYYSFNGASMDPGVTQLGLALAGVTTIDIQGGIIIGYA